MKQTKERLSHQTDHQALIAACREMLTNREKYGATPDVHGGTDAEVRKSFPDPRDPAIPEAIKRLGARKIVLEDDFVRLVLYPGGYHRVDVVGFREGANEELWASRIGRGQRLAPGLWYYEDVNE